MKKEITLILTLVLLSLNSFAQVISSKQNGVWNDGNTWNGTNQAPGYTLTSNNNTYITISSGNDINTDLHNLTITGNNGIIDIYGKLTIEGDLIIDANGWDINVASTGLFTVTDDVAFTQPAQGNNASPDLTINGVATIGGDLTGTGNLLGNGDLYMAGSVIGDVEVTLFEGNIVYGNTDPSLPAPSNLQASEIPSPTRVFLDWDFPVLAPEVTAGYDFIGFQVYTNNSRPVMPTHSSELIAVSHITGRDYITSAVKSYMHNASFLPGQTPKYYVRAAYWDKTKLSMVYSTISVYDFLGNGVLPISLVSLEAKQQGSSITISWTTATELNNMGFEIQRRDNNTDNWYTIGFVEGHYNHNGIINYTFNDNTPEAGTNYYRLKQLDLDGAFEYHGPVAENIERVPESIQVVKTAGIIKVIATGQGDLQIFDISGRVVSTHHIGENFNFPYTQGTYILRYFNGSFVSTTKIIL